MITFKLFLAEGGKATSKFNVSRANKQDIEKAIKQVARTLGVAEDVLRDGLLGSTEATLSGHKKDSGDIDIAISPELGLTLEKANAKMLELTGNEGYMNKGTKIGSYAVAVGGKKVQVDLMFVNNREWAKFIFHSAQGRGSKYQGAVRNILLMAAVRFTHEPGKDMIIKKDDQVIARASRALKLDVGLERMFKRATESPRQKGKWSASMKKVSPEELQKHADQLTGKPVKFSHDVDVIDTPDDVARFCFGKSVKAKDIMTAENVIKQIKKLSNSQEILDSAKAYLALADLPIPEELE